MAKFLFGILGGIIFAFIAVLIMQVLNLGTGILYYIIVIAACVIGLFTFEALFAKFKKK